MYNSYYGFTEKPFSLTPDPHFLYLSSVHKRALAYLTYGLEDKKGFITITGEIGAGKTTLIRALMKQLDTKTTVSRIINPKVSSLQLLKMILRDFSLDVSSESKDDLLDRLNTFLLAEYSRGHSCVIIVDEAQNLEPVALEEIRLLSNLETDKDKLLQIILVGQPELKEILSLPELKQLRQRVAVSYHISPLTMDEVNDYIHHRLLVAGIKDRELFTQAAMGQIALASKGIPRLINIICDAALVTGYVEGAKVLNEKLLGEVLSELDLDQMIQQPSTPTGQNTSLKKSETRHTGGGLQLQNLEIQELIGMVNELRRKLDERNNWEKRLAQKEEELDAKETELCGKLKQMLQLEQKLLTREEQLRQKEQNIGIRGK